jgi:hypothetical protein
MSTFRIRESVLAKLAITLLIVVLAVALAVVLFPGKAKADPGVGCETVRWGLFGVQRRSICDTPRRADGSWTRAREVWIPEGYVPLSTYCSRYSCSSSGGYWQPRSTVAFEVYPVTDGTVLHDEPGWLPTGSLVIR